MITPDYISDENGIGLRATVTALGNNDLAWCNVTPSAKNVAAVAATPVSDAQIRINFSLPVTLADLSGVTVGGQPVTTTQTKDDDSWLVTATASGEVVIAEGAFRTVMGGADVPAATLTLSDTVTAALSDLVDGRRYHFMNADTGRALAVGQVDEFLAVASGNGWYLTDNGRYLDLTGDAPVMSDIPVLYRIEEVAYNRHQIVVDKGVVTDTDMGDDAAVSLAMNTLENDSICTGWLVTESGQPRPLKLLFIGASRTYGSNPDGFEHGWRDTFTQELVDYLDGRVVAVGLSISGSTSITDKMLLRNEGRPGWVAVDDFNDTPSIGLIQVVDEVVTKYTPDVSFIDVGGNDVAHADKTAIVNGTNGELERLLGNYEQLLHHLMPQLSENGALLSNANFPGIPTSSNTPAREILTQAQFELIEQLRDQGYSAYCNDANPGWPSDGWASDGHHSHSGDAHVTACFIENFKKLYDENGVKRRYEVTVQAPVGVEVVAESNSSSPVMVGLPYSFRLELDDTASDPLVTANGQTLTAVNGVYTLPDLFADVAVQVSATLDLQGQLNAAGVGDTVKLTGDVDLSDKPMVVVPLGVTLDLNGYVLTANVVSTVTSSSHVIDSSEGKGGIRIAKNKAQNEEYTLMLLESNDMLALYDEAFGGYRFFTVTMVHLGRPGAADSYKFGIRPELVEEGLTLLRQAANADVTLQILVEVTVDGRQMVSIPYCISAQTLSLYASKMQEESGYWVITLTVSGLDKVQGDTVTVSSTPALISSTGAAAIPVTDATKTYQYR